MRWICTYVTSKPQLGSLFSNLNRKLLKMDGLTLHLELNQIIYLKPFNLDSSFQCCSGALNCDSQPSARLQ